MCISDRYFNHRQLGASVYQTQQLASPAANLYDYEIGLAHRMSIIQAPSFMLGSTQTKPFMLIGWKLGTAQTRTQN